MQLPPKPQADMAHGRLVKSVLNESDLLNLVCRRLPGHGFKSGGESTKRPDQIKEPRAWQS